MAGGLPAAQLVLEITETAIMQNTDVAVGVLRDLREHGVRVAMDDSGTGYSSLAYLRDLPISALKIDRSFVADITEQREALAIVAWIVDLARAVGVAVVTEGVETAEQVALLRGLGCATAQGWLWGPAVPLTALMDGHTWMSPPATTATPVACTGATPASRTASRGRANCTATGRSSTRVPASRTPTPPAAEEARRLRDPAARRRPRRPLHRRDRRGQATER